MGDGHSKKTKLTFFILIVLLTSVFLIVISDSAKSEFQLWPAKLEIEISSYPDGEIQYKKISVTNTGKYNVTVTVDVEHPPSHRINENYSYIPDLSWIKVTPENLTISPKSTGFFTVHVDVPEKQRSQHYNEKWEVWAIFYERIDDKNESNIRMKLASKIRIYAPSGDITQGIPYSTFIILFVIGELFFCLVLFYFSKNEKKSNNKKTVLYFFRKKRNGFSNR